MMPARTPGRKHSPHCSDCLNYCYITVPLQSIRRISLTQIVLRVSDHSGHFSELPLYKHRTADSYSTVQGPLEPWDIFQNYFYTLKDLLGLTDIGGGNLSVTEADDLPPVHSRLALLPLFLLKE